MGRRETHSLLVAPALSLVARRVDHKACPARLFQPQLVVQELGYPARVGRVFCEIWVLSQVGVVALRSAPV